jgi:hypothetical protein
MRCVGATGGVVHEPGSLCVLRPDGVQPLDGLVGKIVREIVRLPVLALGHAEHRIVLRDDGVVLARGATQEAPVVVEAPGPGPVVEGPCRALDVVGREVPFAEAAGDVTVFL